MYTKAKHAQQLALAQSLLETFLSIVNNNGLVANGDFVLQALMPDGRILEFQHAMNSPLPTNHLAFMSISVGTDRAYYDVITTMYDVETSTVCDSAVFEGDVYQNQGHIQWAFADMEMDEIEALRVLLTTVENWTQVSEQDSAFFQPRA